MKSLVLNESLGGLFHRAWDRTGASSFRFREISRDRISAGKFRERDVSSLSTFEITRFRVGQNCPACPTCLRRAALRTLTRERAASRLEGKYANVCVCLYYLYREEKHRRKKFNTKNVYCIAVKSPAVRVGRVDSSGDNEGNVNGKSPRCRDSG